jgi:hypothetical protein
VGFHFEHRPKTASDGRLAGEPGEGRVLYTFQVGVGAADFLFPYISCDARGSYSFDDLMMLLPDARTRSVKPWFHRSYAGVSK